MSIALKYNESEIKELVLLPATKELLSQWAALLNQAFDYDASQKFEIDFAPLFEESNLENATLGFDKSGLVSCASYLINEFTTLENAKDSTKKIALIGAVATRKDCRGYGYSKAVLDAVESACFSHGVDGIILCSNEIEYYAKRGYHPLGEQLVFEIDSLGLQTLDIDRLCIEAKWDEKQVRALYAQHKLRTNRTHAQWMAHSKITSCLRYQCLDHTGKVLAYLGLGRGKDMQDIIHEWGGETKALRILVGQVLKHHGPLFWLTSNDLLNVVKEDPFIDELRERTPLLRSPLCLYKPKPLSLLPKGLWMWGLDSI